MADWPLGESVLRVFTAMMGEFCASARVYPRGLFGDQGCVGNKDEYGLQKCHG